MAEINLGNDTTLNTTLSTEEPINTVAQDVNYIPGYKAAEEERRANEEVRISNENDRIDYYNEIQRKVNNGEFNGRDGAIQYTAGENIQISDENVISATDTTYTAGTGISITNGVINNTKNSATWGQLNGTLTEQTDLKNALDGKANVNSIPTKVSDLQNDSNFVDNTVNNLTNYYTKTETYSKNEVDAAIGQIPGFNVVVVQTLPITNIDTHTIYLKPKTGASPDVYDEYIYVSNSWELIGNTAVDLSNYYTKSEVDTALSGKQNTLTSGTTIKTINSTSVLGPGDIRTHFVSLIAVDDTAPAECQEGDKYFNTTDNLIYTATDTDTWSSTGESPIEGIFYIVFEEQTTYAYNGTTLISVGGGAGGGGDNEPIGKVVPMVLETAPDGYLLCDGSIYTKAQYPDLFKIMKNTVFQTDDEEFQVPNIQGKVIVGKKASDTDFSFVGKNGGSKELQEHTHNVSRSGYWSTDNYQNVQGRECLAFETIPGDPAKYLDVSKAGTGHSGNLQPYIVLNYFIKAQKLSGDVILSESLPVGTEVEFDGQASDIPVGWEEVSGKTLVAYELYNNTSGTTGSITLSDNISNYKIIELVAVNNDDTTETFDTYRFDTSLSKFRLMGESVGATSFNIFEKTYTKGTNSLTTTTGKLYNGSNGSITNYDVFKIIKVIGYKEV